MNSTETNDARSGAGEVLAADRRAFGLATISALVSTTTLLCCALPIMLVSVGLGATLAALTAHFPILIALSEYQVWMFATSGGLVGVSAWLLWRPAACPSDPLLAAVCVTTRKWGKRLLFTALSIWVVGFFFTYLALPLRIWLDG